MRSCVLLPLIMLTEVVFSAKFSVTIPKVVTAVAGSCAEIRCTFNYPVYQRIGDVTWLKILHVPGKLGFPIIYDSKLIFRKHYNYLGRAEFKCNIRKKRCYLLLKDIRKSDEGIYQLFIENASARHIKGLRTLSAHTFLSVLETPRISSYGELIAGKTARFTCSITHNCPNGNLQLRWIKYNVSLPLPWDTQEGEGMIKEHSEYRKISSVLTFTPSSAHDGNILGCTILMNGIPSPSAQNLILEIKYGPNIPAVNSSIVAVEGSSLLLYCTADGKPLVSLRWVKNGEDTSRSSIGELKQIFRNIRSEDDGEYWCIAENALGTTNRSTQISVQYKPTILSGPTCTSSANWTNCSCRIRANPPGNITWGLNGRIHTGDRSDVEIISWAVNSHLMESSLRLTHPTGTGNLISCVAANEHGDSVSKYQLHAKGIYSRTILLIIRGGATGIVLLIAVVLLLKIQRKKSSEPACVPKTDSGAMVYTEVLNGERDDHVSPANDATSSE